MDEENRLEDLRLPDKAPDSLTETTLATSNDIVETWDDDISEIKTLTANEARQLLNNYKDDGLGLYSLESIDEETAKVLATFKGKWMYLYKLKNIDANSAKRLAEFKGDMICIGIESINEEIAKNLAKFNGDYLSIGGHIKEIDAQSARNLISFKGSVLDLGFDEINSEIAEILASFDGDSIYLSNLEKIDKETAEILATFKGDRLDLRGLKSIDDDVIDALANFKGCNLTLYGLDDDTQRKIELKRTGDYDKYIQDEITEHFTRNDITENATKIKSLTANEARELLKNYGREQLYLHSLESIDEETAKILSSFEGDMLCIGLNSIDEEIAENLAKFNGDYLSIGGHIKEIDAQSARNLISFKGSTLSLGIEQINTEIAKILTSFEGNTIYLCELEKIDKEAAEILATFKGDRLDLRGLKSIDDDVIDALANFKGRDLTLYGLDKNTQYKVKLKKTINDNKKNNIQEEVNEIENEKINEHIESIINKLKNTSMIKGWTAAEEITNELGNEIRNMGDNSAIKGVLNFFDRLLYSIGYTDTYAEDNQLNYEDNSEGNIFDYKENKIVKTLLKMYLEKFNKILGQDELRYIDYIDEENDEEDDEKDYKYKYFIDKAFKDVPENIKNHLIKNINLIRKLGHDIDDSQNIEKPFEDFCEIFFNKGVAQALMLNISCENLENKIKTRRQQRKGIKNVIQNFIKKDTENSAETNDGEKGNILYDYNKGTIISRGKEVKLESINNNAILKGSDLSYLKSVVRLDKGTSWVEDHGPEREETSIRLEGLNMNLKVEDGIWLANFKNRIKYKYGNKKVEYNERKQTFYIEKSELIKNSVFKEYFKIDNYCTSIIVMDGREIRDRHDKDEEEIMKKISEWLNK